MADADINKSLKGFAEYPLDKWVFALLFGAGGLFVWYLFANYDVSRLRGDWKGLGAMLGLAITGVSIFLSGFKKLKAKRVIQDIPTSSIATGAVGTHVEIKGRLLSDQKYKLTPFGGKPCSFYSLEIKEYVSDFKTSEWQTNLRFYSNDSFYVEDKSGAHALVYVDHASFFNKRKPLKWKFRGKESLYIRDGLKRELERRQISIDPTDPSSPLYGSKSLFMVVENYFGTREEVYVLGYADSGTKYKKHELPPMRASKKKLGLSWMKKTREMILAIPAFQKRFDTNRDGVLSDHEVADGVKTLGRELKQQETDKLKAGADHTVKMVFQYRKSNLFIISNKPEHDLVKGLAWKSAASIYGGALLTIVLVALLYWTVHTLPPK